MEVHLPHPVGVGLTYRAQLTIEVDLKKIVWVWTKSKIMHTLISKSRSRTLRVFGFMLKTPVTSSPFLQVR